MWPIGHASVAYLCYAAVTRRRLDAGPEPIAAVFLAVGSQFPDLVDKPFAWYLPVLPAGRSLMHSFFLLVPVAALVYLLARRRGTPEYGVAFGVGAISHTLVDTLPVLWNPDATWTYLFWPLLSVSGYEEGAPSILALFRDSLSDPYFLLEFVLLAVALALWRADGYPGLGLFVPGRTSS